MATNRFPGIGYNTNGRDFNFFEKVSVESDTFGGGSVSGEQPDIVITFSTQSIMLINEGTGVIEWSLNGNTVHGELDSEKATSALSFDNRVISKMWFRVKSGSTGPIDVNIMAWGVR